MIAAGSTHDLRTIAPRIENEPALAHFNDADAEIKPSDFWAIVD